MKELQHKRKKPLKFMLKRSIFILLACLICWQIFGQQSDRLEYIDRYKEIAIAEMERAGVPASIKLAQGLLESNAGKSTLAKRANNHFGMKCGSAWKGKTYAKEDDDYDADGNLIKSCFRVYKNAKASYIAHSEFLRDPNKNYRYGFLFRLPPTDYKAWAKGLKKAGYATSPTYAQNLINTIETYELFRYDRMSSVDVDVGEVIAEVPVINGVKVAYAQKAETAADIALRSNVSVSRLLKYNERINDASQFLKKGQRVFLQRKRSNYRGKKKYHYVKAKETMFLIAQTYGLRLEKLYKKNRMKEGTQPAVGEKLKLRGWKVKDAPRLNTEAPVDGQDTEFDWEDDRPGEEENGSDFEIDFEEPPVWETEQEDPPATDPAYHTVVAGDTLFGLSRKYGTSVERIKQLNNLSGNVISVGQRLRVQ